MAREDAGSAPVTLDGRRYLSDGHIRVLAGIAGAETVRVRPGPDRDDLPLDLYRKCVGWCDSDYCE